MSLTQLLNQTGYLLARNESGTLDDYGNDVPDEVVTAISCEIQQRRRDEDADEGETSQADWLGIFAADTDLTTADAVAVNGMGTFELVGAPWPVYNPRTREVSHVEATLRRTAGAEDAS